MQQCAGDSLPAGRQGLTSKYPASAGTRGKNLHDSVGREGFEPSRLAAPAPKAGVSAVPPPALILEKCPFPALIAKRSSAGTYHFIIPAAIFLQHANCKLYLYFFQLNTKISFLLKMRS
jgi:hypothetical protein